MLMESRAFWFNCNAIPVWENDLKPGASTDTRYWPTGRSGIVKEPSEELVADLVSPVVSSVAEIRAPATIAPEGSSIVPRSVAVFCCACAGAIQQSAAAIRLSARWLHSRLAVRGNDGDMFLPSLSGELLVFRG